MSEQEHALLRPTRQEVTEVLKGIGEKSDISAKDLLMLVSGIAMAAERVDVLERALVDQVLNPDTDPSNTLSAKW